MMSRKAGGDLKILFIRIVNRQADRLADTDMVGDRLANTQREANTGADKLSD